MKISLTVIFFIALAIFRINMIILRNKKKVKKKTYQDQNNIKKLVNNITKY